MAIKSVTPHLVVKDGGAAIDFYKKAFGAVENFRLAGPDGVSVIHAELSIGGESIFVASAYPGMNVVWPEEGQGAPVSLHLCVDDADAALKQAVDAGCRVLMPLQDMFWGDRYGQVADPFGHHWSIAHHIEDVTAEEMQKRAATMFG